MKATAERIQRAGLKPGFHTLTACISTADPWVTPVPSPREQIYARQAAFGHRHDDLGQ